MDEQTLVKVLGEAIRTYSYDFKDRETLGPFKDMLKKDAATVKVSLRHGMLVVKPVVTGRKEVKKVVEENKSLQQTVKEQAETIKEQEKTIKELNEEKETLPIGLRSVKTEYLSELEPTVDVDSKLKPKRRKK